MQLQQRIPNATKKSQLPGLKHSALAVPSSQAEDFSASWLKKYLFERGNLTTGMILDLKIGV